MNFKEAIAKIRKESLSNRERGDCFEKIAKTFFQQDPHFKDLFAKVWQWHEWPDRDGQDTGIDLVAQERNTGNLWAIQCKFYEPFHYLQKDDIDSFLSDSGKSFPDGSGKSGKKHFSHRLILSTTDKWSSHAEKAIIGQVIPCQRIGVDTLAESPVEWESIHKPEEITRRDQKDLRPHQETALESVLKSFETADRGKLIMACGTGKTLTSLRIAEAVAAPNGLILFLVPSISLLSQSLREWSAEAKRPLRCFAVCSDSKIGRNSEDMRTHELEIPATTDCQTLAKKLAEDGGGRMNVIFSTYHSIDVIAGAQKLGAPALDLVICDEAHRTTGVERKEEEASYFVKIHNNKFLRAKKRLYMTATPRIYSASDKAKAKQHDVECFSMDDEATYGKEFHRLDFSKAVAKNLLSDYRLLVLAVNEAHISASLQKSLAESGELQLEDAAKIIGCWNGLGRRFVNPEAADEAPDPMRRAVAFCNTIKNSKQVAAMFSDIVAEYQKQQPEVGAALSCDLKHVDGKMNSLQRNSSLAWLKETPPKENQPLCRILSNARCLSEGVDVPALDAVMFLNPRKSVVDVVQSVGRVMRKADNKQYGYVILPIAVPPGVPAEQALNDNKRYQVVWEVLQALRAHDDRLKDDVNKLELNKQAPDTIQVIGVGWEDEDQEETDPEKQQRLSLNFSIDEYREAIYAKIVLKCGDRRYWETWAKDVAKIAEAHKTRIQGLLQGANTHYRTLFDEFLHGLRDNVHPAIIEEEAVEMLSQHLITKPVFNALFENYDFAAQNPVSKTMQSMLDLLEDQQLDAETHKLDKFYETVRNRASGIDNAEGKQKIIIELYDKFFKTAFPKMASRLGIVYTPIEIVDFILQSAEDLMRKEFGKGLSDEGVDILDPFTGTGSFIVRLLQMKFIESKDLARKYNHELHANEVILLAYYIAAINIENAYHERMSDADYEPFPGILFTDTFQLEEKNWMEETFFPENYSRAKRQRKRPIRVIIGNPPYSSGQRDEGDDNKNLKYPKLDTKIRETYAKDSSATNLNSLYDSYIRALRWASDRIGEEGIIAFVSNGYYIDGNAADGLRKCLAEDFTSIFCFNLRGNIRKNMLNKHAGEGGNVFGQASMTGIAITLFCKNPAKANNGPCKIYYFDIGDDLKEKQKLQIIKELGTIARIDWREIQPNAQYDWINQRSPEFATFLPLGDKENKKKGGKLVPSVFRLFSRGVATSRDAWVYNFSQRKVAEKMQSMIAFYNSEVRRYQKALEENQAEDSLDIDIDKFVNSNATKIGWSRGLKYDLAKQKSASYSESKIRQSIYCPFSKQWLYFDKQFNEMIYQQSVIFPTPDTPNLVICVCADNRRDFSVLMADTIPNLTLVSASQCFPLYTYGTGNGTEEEEENGSFKEVPPPYRMDNIPDDTLARFQKHYQDKTISKLDIFYYVYGLLHSPQYKTKYAADLKKMLPRIPMHPDFWAFSQAGQALGDLHVHYENADEFPLQEEPADLGWEKRKVIKMKFPKKEGKADKTKIVYNPHLTLAGVPLEAYDYMVNGKSAIEWVMDRYQCKTDKDSQITNNPNDWIEDENYIVSLLKKVVTVSIESARIINKLPSLEEGK